MCVWALIGLFLFWWAARWVNFFLKEQHNECQRSFNNHSEVFASDFRKLFCLNFPDAGNTTNLALKPGQNKVKACGSVFGRMDEWMKPLCLWCSILGVVWSHRSRRRPPPGPPVPPLVTSTQWALLTLVGLTLSHSGSTEARSPLISGWKVTAVFLSREKPNRHRWSPPPPRTPLSQRVRLTYGAFQMRCKGAKSSALFHLQELADLQSLIYWDLVIRVGIRACKHYNLFPITPVFVVISEIFSWYISDTCGLLCMCCKHEQRKSRF